MEKPDARLDQIMADNHLTGTVFDAYRIVDVENNMVCSMRDNRAQPTGVLCYDIWGHGMPCENCISRRAQVDRKQVVKMECTDTLVFLVIAVPVVIDGKETVLELIKNMSDSLVSYGASRMQHQRMQELIGRMNMLMVTDPFTKLYNKTYIKEQLLREIEEPERLVAVMLDIDNFKPINDTYGHHVGDQVIAQIAERIRLSVDEEHSWAARFGGEEFLLIYHSKSVEEVCQHCERLRAEIGRDFVIASAGNTVRVTASFGIHAFEAGVDDVDSLLRRADENLYVSKRNGKNMITCA